MDLCITNWTQFLMWRIQNYVECECGSDEAYAGRCAGQAKDHKYHGRNWQQSEESRVMYPWAVCHFRRTFWVIRWPAVPHFRNKEEDCDGCNDDAGSDCGVRPRESYHLESTPIRRTSTTSLIVQSGRYWRFLPLAASRRVLGRQWPRSQRILRIEPVENIVVISYTSG